MGVNAYFEVECTNDYVRVERFRYERREIAIEVAKSQTIHFSEVAVHAVFSYVGDWDEETKNYPLKTLKRTIYHEVCDDEDVVITADGAIPADQLKESEEE